MKKLILAILLFPALAFGQVISTGRGGSSFSGTAPSFTATAASGSDAFIAVQGANLKLGTATLSFNGTALAASVGIEAPSVTTTAVAGANAMTIVNESRICLLYGCSAYLANVRLSLSAGGYITATQMHAHSGYGMIVRGYIANGSTAIAVKSGNFTTLTAPGSVIHGFYPDAFVTLKASIDKDGTYSMDGTDSSGTPGAVTINQPLMIVAIDDTASTLVVTNSIVTATTPVFCQAQQVDATCTSVVATVPAAGSFTINMNAACTAHTKIACVVHGMF